MPELGVRFLGRSLHGSVDRNKSILPFVETTSVAPFTGAWIETFERKAEAVSAWSLPSRERGSKPPLRFERVQLRRDVVAPFTGAWIETRRTGTPFKRTLSLPSRERGSKLLFCGGVVWMLGRSLHGSVDRNTRRQSRRLTRGRRSLHGSVDRNPRLMAATPVVPGRSLHGSVDRNRLSKRLPSKAACRSLHGSVDRNLLALASLATLDRRSLHGSVDRNALTCNRN